MAAAENKALLRELFDAVLNAHDPAALQRYIPPHYVQHQPGLPRDREGLQRTCAALWAACPDWHGSPTLLVAEDDLVFAFTTWTGTHTSTPLLGVRSAGARLTVDSADLFRVVAGQLVEHWAAFDRLRLLRQLGLAPQTAPLAKGEAPTRPASARASPRESKALLRRMMTELFNRRDMDRADEYYATDFIQHNPEVPHGRAGFKSFFGARFAAYPDWHGTLDHLLAEDDLAVAWITWRGTHTGGQYLGVPPRGEIMTYKTADAFRVVDGQLAEHWDVPDRLTMLQQLGLLALPAAAQEWFS